MFCWSQSNKTKIWSADITNWLRLILFRILHTIIDSEISAASHPTENTKKDVVVKISVPSAEATRCIIASLLESLHDHPEIKMPKGEGFLEKFLSLLKLEIEGVPASEGQLELPENLSYLNEMQRVIGGLSASEGLRLPAKFNSVVELVDNLPEYVNVVSDLALPIVDEKDISRFKGYLPELLFILTTEKIIVALVADLSPSQLSDKSVAFMLHLVKAARSLLKFAADQFHGMKHAVMMRLQWLLAKVVKADDIIDQYFRLLFDMWDVHDSLTSKRRDYASVIDEGDDFLCLEWLENIEAGVEAEKNKRMEVRADILKLRSAMVHCFAEGRGSCPSLPLAKVVCCLVDLWLLVEISLEHLLLQVQRLDEFKGEAVGLLIVLGITQDYILIPKISSAVEAKGPNVNIGVIAKYKEKLDFPKFIQIRRANPNTEAEQLDFLCFASTVSDEVGFKAGDLENMRDIRPNFQQVKKNASKHNRFFSKVAAASRNEMLTFLEFLKDVPSTLKRGTFASYVFTVDALYQVRAAIHLMLLGEWNARKLVVGNVGHDVRQAIGALCSKHRIKIVSG